MFTLFGEQVFTQVNAWERCCQNVGEHYHHSEFLNLQRWFKVFLGGSAWQEPHGDGPGMKVVADLTSHWGMWDGHLQWLQGSEVQHSSHGHSHLPIHMVLEGHPSLGVKPGVGGGHLLGTRARSSGDAAPCSLNVGRGLGAVVLVGSSALCISEGTLFKGVVAMGSFITPSHISFSMLNKLPFSTKETRQSWSSCTTLQDAFWEAPAWMAHLHSTSASATISSLCTCQ